MKNNIIFMIITLIFVAGIGTVFAAKTVTGDSVVKTVETSNVCCCGDKVECEKKCTCTDCKTTGKCEEDCECCCKDGMKSCAADAKCAKKDAKDCADVKKADCEKKKECGPVKGCGK